MSFKKRLKLYVAGITAVCLAAYLVFSSMWLRSAYTSHIRETAGIAFGAAAYFSDSPPADPGQFAHALAAAMPEGSSVVFLDSEGAVIGGSAGEGTPVFAAADYPEVAQALRTGYGEDVRRSDVITGRDTFYCARIIADGLYIRIAMPYAGVDGYILSGLPPLLLMGLFIFAFASFILRRVSSTLTAPYHNMTRMLETALESGDVSAMPGQLSEMADYDELEPLLSNYQKLLERLNGYIGEIRDKAEKMDHIAACMHEGLFMLDVNMEVLLINNTALKFLGLKSPGAEKSFARLCRIPLLVTKVREVLDTREPCSIEIEYDMPDTRNYRANISPAIWDGKIHGVIILVSDITSWARYDQLRSEFVANVSHELKTPITSIRGFAELLYNDMVEDPAQVKHQLNLIISQSSRLIDIINDLLLLSEAEHGENSGALSKVSLRAAADDAAASLAQAAKDKNVSVSVKGEGYILAQEVYIGELAFNLIENAIKYNVVGGSVSVTVWQNDSEAGITVADTGIGIPQSHQERIFERFYRVDKGRNSKTGGTGLGLSIVKHIIELYSGRASLSSRPVRAPRSPRLFPP